MLSSLEAQIDEIRRTLRHPERDAILAELEAAIMTIRQALSAKDGN